MYARQHRSAFRPKQASCEVPRSYGSTSVSTYESVALHKSKTHCSCGTFPCTQTHLQSKTTAETFLFHCAWFHACKHSNHAPQLHMSHILATVISHRTIEVHQVITLRITSACYIKRVIPFTSGHFDNQKQHVLVVASALHCVMYPFSGSNFINGILTNRCFIHCWHINQATSHLSLPSWPHCTSVSIIFA
jgi:hypothetical protein